MNENQIATIIIESSIEIHKEIGPGLLESAYESILAYSLSRKGLAVERQVPISLLWKDMLVDVAYRADLIVGGLVIVELKSVEKFHPVHAKQLLTYLRIADKRLGLLINFGLPVLKDGIQRVINGIIPRDDALFDEPETDFL
ncbi:MAG TPA: GxxExxY protein [Spirochaetaceae bacterium]|jgi:GxxExxY protein|nr:GxxExxY protein [Spirochaetaceae bacterium]